MSKKCNLCGAILSDDARFCTSCGGSDFSAQIENAATGGFAAAGEYAAQNVQQTPPPNMGNPYGQTPPANDQGSFGQATWQTETVAQQNPYAQNNYNQTSPYGQPGWQQTPPPPEKKKRTGLIVLIIVIALILVVAIGIVLWMVLGDDKNNGGSDNSDKESIVQTTDGDEEDDGNPTATPDENFGYATERPLPTKKPVTAIPSTPTPTYEPIQTEEPVPSEEPEAVPYTKGTFDGKTYVNEWANVKFDIPYGFYDADESQYKSAESAGADCGFYFVTSSSGFVQYYFERMPYDTIDEEIYLDIVLAKFKSTFESAGMSYNLIEEDVSHSIAGNVYKNADFELSNGTMDFVCSMYARKMDNYMAVFSVMGESVSENDALIKRVSRVN